MVEKLAGLPGNSRDESKEPELMSQQEVMPGITGQVLQPKARKQLVSTLCETTSSELSPTSVGQSMSLDSNNENSCLPVAGLQNIYTQKPAFSSSPVKASSADGYIWRKYGQKQVKIPQGFRSYFRCAYSECCAKKIEFSDQSGLVMEITYKSAHNHDPLRKVNSVIKRRILQNEGLVNNVTEHSTRVLNGSNPSTSSREPARDTSMVPGEKLPDSGSFNRDAETTSTREDALESEANRGSKNIVSISNPLLKPGKKPKFVVHAAGDYGSSDDGYKWRKYGQKMVKGNNHPRSYYRCTSAGCPVRKQIETAVDDVSAVTITYRGIHNHDMAVHKKTDGLPDAPTVTIAPPASLSSSPGKKPNPSHTDDSPT